MGWPDFGTACTTPMVAGWTGPCTTCQVEYQAENCYIEYSPPVVFYRDDLMDTGFIPAKSSASYVTLKITSVLGDDFQAAKLCGTADLPAGSELYVSLASMSVLGSGGGTQIG